MAQKSIHILNKNGNSMFWSSMWDDKINYSKSFKKQIFLQNFFNFLLEDLNSINFFKKYENHFKFFLNSSINFKIKNNIKISNCFYNLKNYENNFYNSRIWLIKFHNWFIIFFFVFDTKNKKKNNKSIMKFKNNLNNFLLNMFKLNKNFNLFNKKYFF